MEWMSRIFKEPLVHFLLIGAALFVVYGQLNETEEAEESQQKIIVSSGRIEQLANIFAKTWQRPPTREELQGIIDDFVLEEVYYRQAIDMGLERDDTIIRRRLRQKLEFLTDDTASLVEPSDAELQAYLVDHEDMFRESGKYSFRQVYFNPERYGDDPEGYVKEQLAVLNSNGSPVGDVSLLPESVDDFSRRAVDGTFGTGFAQQLDSLETGSWQGPVQSGLGLHLVRIDNRVPGRLPELAEIREIVQREWSNAKRVELRAEINARMLEAFEVVIDWPEGTNPAASEDEVSNEVAGGSP